MTPNTRAGAAYRAAGPLVSKWHAYETGWEDGYKASRHEAGLKRDGGEGHGARLGLVGSSGQASGDLLARHLPCPMFTSMLFDTLWQVWYRQITAPEQRAVDDCMQAVRDLIAKLGGRTEDR